MGEKQSGFTFIELILVMAIVGILVAIAIPSYNDSISKGRRADGKALLMDLASREERFYLQRNTYTTSIEGSSELNTSSISQGGFYAAGIMACPKGEISDCYQITVTAIGVQLSGDPGCKTLGLSSTGVRSSKDSGGSESTLCW